MEVRLAALPAALTLEKEPPVPTKEKVRWVARLVWTLRLAPAGESNHESTVVQPLA
jgi:hypothetical protein